MDHGKRRMLVLVANQSTHMLVGHTFRFPLVVNAFPQTEHLKGLSPVCVLMWICRADPDEKPFLHTWQRCFTAPPLLLLLPPEGLLLLEEGEGEGEEEGEGRRRPDRNSKGRKGEERKEEQLLAGC